MPRRKSRNKKSKTMQIIMLATGALASLFVLFLILDQFTLYWFVLFNQDDTMDRRQQDGAEWYGSWASGEDPNFGGTGTPGGTNQGNYGSTGMLGKAELEAMTPEEAVAAVTRTLTDEQIQDPETAWRVFIYLMDRHNFVPNAIIGAMSYVKAEGAGMGTFTYESYWLCPGPDGNKSSRHLGNQDWLDWLDGDGFEWAAANYASRRAKGEKLAYAAIGIGSVQSSDVWSGPGNKNTSNATQMIQAANEKGLYWQDPGFQMPNLMSRYFVASKPFGKSAWDVNDCPGVDPTTDNNVTAFEWSKRVLCGVGYPGWKSSEFSDTNKHVVAHAAGIEECTNLYNQYSKKDPWFYTECALGTSDWHDPFSGQIYDNSTAQGLMIARCAVLLAGRDRSASGKLMRTSADNTYSNPEMVADPGLQYYREAKHELESTDNYFASCDRAASTAIILAGVDTGWTSFGPCSTLISHCNNSTAWEPVGKMKDTQLQPGDVLFENSSGGHIAIWVGTNVAGEKYPGTTANIYQASLDSAGSEWAYFPDVSYGNPQSNYWGTFEVYRCISPLYSGAKWEQFRNGAGSKFIELTATWRQTTAAESRPTPPTDPTGSTGTWVLPIDCAITSNFGMRMLNGHWEGHRAYDFHAPEGTALLAPMNGTVLKVVDGRDNAQGSSDDLSWGNYLTLEHPDGKVTLYAHLKKGSFTVSAGDTVSAGQTMAQTGNTGNSYGAHLHLELWPDRSHGSNNDMMDCLQLFPGLTYKNKDGQMCTVPAN